MEPIASGSPPFGVSTVTDGVERLITTVEAEPTVAAMGPLLQSRNVTLRISRVGDPPSAELVSATLNRVPLSAEEPHGRPSVTPSALYTPPP